MAEVAVAAPAVRPAPRTRPRVALARLAWRSCRTGSIVVVLAVVALMAVGLTAVTESAAIQGLDLQSLVDNPAIRALYGNAYDLSQAGGFVTWRYGQTLAVIVSIWAMLTSTRLLRGDEEAGRTELVLAGPTTPREVIGATAAVLGLVAVALAGGMVVVFLASGQPVAGSVLFSLGYGLVLATFAGVGAVTAQVFSQRRRAAGAAGALLAGAYLVRMVADAGETAWLRWLTPFGWLEELQPFAADRAIALVPLVLAPLVLAALAVTLAARRDLGEGLLRDTGTAEARPAGLGGAAGYALRQRTGSLIGWGIGMAVFGVVSGGITSAFVDFTQTSASFAELAATFGMVELSTPEGFVATMDTFAALVLVAYAISSMHLLAEDETTGRLELALAAPVTRRRWLVTAVAATALVLAVLALVVALTTWAGVAMGGASIAVVDSLAAMANLLPLVVLFTGVAVALHGIRPGLTTSVTSTLLVASYLLSFLGPALSWPDWVLALSPFRHVAAVPAEPVAWTPALVMGVAGLVLVAIGVAAFERRDLGS